MRMPKATLDGGEIEDPMQGLGSDAIRILALIRTRGASVAAKLVWQEWTVRLLRDNASFSRAILELSSANMIEALEDPLSVEFLSKGRLVVTEKGLRF